METGSRIRHDDVIYQCGYAALEASVILSEQVPEKLTERFSPFFVQRTASFREILSGQAAVTARTAADAGAILTTEAGEGGIFAALWELWKETGRGFDIRMGEIAFLQETIEFLDHFGIDPYKARSGGCFLCVFRPEEAGRAQTAFEDAGIPVHRLGVFRDDIDKRLLHGEHVRFLDRPAPDTLDSYLKKTADRNLIIRRFIATPAAKKEKNDQ